MTETTACGCGRSIWSTSCFSCSARSFDSHRTIICASGTCVTLLVVHAIRPFDMKVTWRWNGSSAETSVARFT